MRARSLAWALLAAVLVLTGCSDKPDKPRRQQTVKLLPDTPPPPPPPPKPEDRPPPKPEDKPQQQEAPKPAEAPQPQLLKSDETAGSGPGNGLAAGAVTRDYTDQKIGQSPTVGAAVADSGSNRLALNAFGNSASRALNEFLVRDRSVKLRDYRVRVQLWLTPSGSLQRAELVDSTGDPQTDDALRAAHNRVPGTSETPPAKLPQPMRVLVSNRLLG
jgi:protein TonB